MKHSQGAVWVMEGYIGKLERYSDCKIEKLLESEASYVIMGYWGLSIEY
jgi:hypothetical protein